MGMSTNFYVGPIAIRIGMAPCRSSICSTSSELIFCLQSERILVSFWLLVSSLSPTCLFATSKRRSLAGRGCLGKVSQWVSLGIGLCVPVVNVSVQMFTPSLHFDQPSGATLSNFEAHVFRWQSTRILAGQRLDMLRSH